MVIKFRKIYSRVNEFYEFKEALIVFDKRPHEYRAELLSEQKAKEKGFQVENIIVNYKYYLRIDLWIIILEFRWLKESKP